MMLTKEEVQKELIEDSRIFHFGTLSSTHEGVREATRHAIELAKEAGCIITFDPNLRPPLWNSLDDARREIEYGMGKCDVLKISDNEVEFLFGTTDYDKGAALIREKYNIPLVLITMGKTEAALITRISEWRLLLSFRKTPLKLPAPEILSAQALSTMFWSMVWRI